MKFIVEVEARTKKNSGRIVMRGRFPKLLPSSAYLQFEKEALPYFVIARNECGCIDYPCNVKCLFYMPTHRRVDLCNLLNAVCDCAVKAGLFTDDNRDIIAGHDGSRVLYDKKHPRIEIEITRIKDYEKWKN